MNNKLIIGLVALSLGLSSFAALKPEKVRDMLAGLSGPDINSPFLKWGGVEHVANSQSLNTATTTPCAIQSPSATSTLVHASLTVQVASSTATTWTLAKASSAFATTTLVGTFSLGSGAQGTMVATSSAIQGTDNLNVVSPNTFLVWGLAGLNGAYDATKLTGICKAEFTVTGR